MSARASTSAPQSGHTAGSGSRTSMANCVRQPRHSPPPSPDVPETPPADALPATAVRSTLLHHRQAHYLVRPRRRPPATTASPAAHRRPSPQPRSCVARPGSLSDRQRTTVSRRARRRPGAQSRATKSLRAVVPGPPLQGEGRPLCNRSSIRPIRTSRNLLDLGSRSWRPQGQRQGEPEGGCALEALPRSVTRNRDAGVPSPRRDPWRTRCLLPTWKTTNNVSNVAGRSFTSASGSGSRSTASHRKHGPAIEITGSGSGRRHRARGHLTGRAVDADRRTAGGASPARPPRRRRHHLRSPGTSPATAAAHRPQSAPGIPSTVPVSSPAARDVSPEDEHRSAAGRSPIAVPDFQTRGGPTTFCSDGRTSSLREAYGP